MAKRRAKGEGSLYFDEKQRRWIAQKIEDGKRIRRVGQTKTEARERLAQALEQSEDVEPVEEEPVAYTVRDLAERFQEDELIWFSEERQTLLRNLIRVHVSDLFDRDAESVSRASVESWLRGKLRTQSAYSLRRLRWLLSRIFAHGVEHGMVSKNPVEKARLPKGTKVERETRAMTEDESRRFLKAAKKEKALYPWILFTLLLGTRPGETSRLLWSDVDLETGKVWIRATKTKPGQKQKRRELELPPSVIEVLKGLPHRDGLVFVNRNGLKQNPGQLRKVVRRIGESIGVEGLTPYSLRHTFAVLSAPRVDIYTLAKHMGHEDLTMLMKVYTAHELEATKVGAVLESFLNEED